MDGEKKLGCFEDEFMEKQIDLIALSIELSSCEPDEVYVICELGDTVLAYNTFYVINGKLYTTDEVEGSYDRILEALTLGTDDLRDIKDICNKYGRQIPTEIKLKYTKAGNGTLEAQYGYQNHDEYIFYSQFVEWVHQVRAELEAHKS